MAASSVAREASTSNDGILRFYFRIDKMRQANHCPSRIHNDIWYPPRVLGWNELVAGDSSGLWFCFDSETRRATRLEHGLPAGSEFFKEVSVYYYHDIFWCVPYDATRYPVGDWKQDVQNDDEEEEDDSEDEEETPTASYMDWHPLRFSYDATTYTSFARLGVDGQTLVSQRPDQQWVSEILPDVYHAPDTHHVTDRRVGALNGDLGLLLALVALSVRPDMVRRAVEHCVRGDGWRATGLPRRAGCKCSRSYLGFTVLICYRDQQTWNRRPNLHAARFGPSIKRIREWRIRQHLQLTYCKTITASLPTPPLSCCLTTEQP